MLPVGHILSATKNGAFFYQKRSAVVIGHPKLDVVFEAKAGSVGDKSYAGLASIENKDVEPLRESPKEMPNRN